MLPTCLDLAASDPNVRGSLAVYVKLFSHLDFVQYRHAKQAQLARVLGMTEVRVGQSLSDLVAYGYLARGPDDGTSNTYRLVVSPAA